MGSDTPVCWFTRLGMMASPRVSGVARRDHPSAASGNHAT
jgi:hypothetical protein